MEVEEVKVPAEDTDNGAAKRSREEDVEAEPEEKRTKTEDGAGEGEAIAAELVVGPKTFDTSVAMFDYFFKLLHSWSPNFNVNKVITTSSLIHFSPNFLSIY